MMPVPWKAERDRCPRGKVLLAKLDQVKAVDIVDDRRRIAAVPMLGILDSQRPHATIPRPNDAARRRPTPTLIDADVVFSTRAAERNV